MAVPIQAEYLINCLAGTSNIRSKHNPIFRIIKIKIIFSHMIDKFHLFLALSWLFLIDLQIYPRDKTYLHFIYQFKVQFYTMSK